MDEAYWAFYAWCEASGVQKPTVHWEVCGPHSDDPNELSLTISWLLEAQDDTQY